MEDAFICRIATFEDMERKWEYEIARHADAPMNWIVWKEGAIANRREGRTLPHYGFTEFLKTDTETYPDGTVIQVEYYAKRL